jgi:hypothetical protein
VRGGAGGDAVGMWNRFCRTRRKCQPKGTRKPQRYRAQRNRQLRRVTSPAGAHLPAMACALAPRRCQAVVAHACCLARVCSTGSRTCRSERSVSAHALLLHAARARARVRRAACARMCVRRRGRIVLAAHSLPSKASLTVGGAQRLACVTCTPCRTASEHAAAAAAAVTAARPPRERTRVRSARGAASALSRIVRARCGFCASLTHPPLSPRPLRDRAARCVRAAGAWPCARRGKRAAAAASVARGAVLSGGAIWPIFTHTQLR